MIAIAFLMAMLACEPDNQLATHQERGEQMGIEAVETVTGKPLQWFNARVNASGRMDLGRAQKMIVWHSATINPRVVILTWYQDDCEIASTSAPANSIEFLLIQSGHFS